MPFLIGGMNMNDMEFIEALKTKRNACGYSQSRLAKELHISRQNLNEIENGKTRASKEMKHTLLHYLDYCKCTQPFTLNVRLSACPLPYDGRTGDYQRRAGYEDRILYP